jgi:GT2 family glycosyltransferase
MAQVTVVIPARNAAATLPATLRALAAQTYDGEVEVVVVDDRSTDRTPEIARAAGARVLTITTGRGPGEARNLGARTASAPLLAFTDADCEPDPGWLAAGVRALQDGADLVQGRILPVRDPGPFDRTLRVEHASPLFETANLLVTRQAFERAGGFPEAGLPLPGGEKSFAEDTLFGWRARRAGARCAFVPEALVRHAVFPRGPRGFIDERRRLRYFPALVRAVPELRGDLPGRVFLSRRTAAFDLAVAGTVVAIVRRRPAIALAAALPYVRLVGAPWPPRRSVLRRLATHVAADAVGAVALARGTAEARTVVL